MGAVSTAISLSSGECRLERSALPVEGVRSWISLMVAISPSAQGRENMKTSRTLAATFLVFGVAVATVGAAVAQSAQGGGGQAGSGMMQGGAGQTGPGMMQGGMGQMRPGMMKDCMGPRAAMPFGARVTPMMNLSVEDVRGYLDMQLERLNNKRLKLGDVQADGNKVTADIVTVDNSLVQRLIIDRRTGAIEYVK
jgi:hypothetical protein